MARPLEHRMRCHHCHRRWLDVGTARGRCPFCGHHQAEVRAA